MCFPIYGIAKVRRRDYFALDRAKLPYLNAVEKMGCTFCSYATGLIAFAQEVTARTEQYWCPIRHAREIPSPHDRYQLFFDFGDGQRYHRELMALRRTMEPGADAGSNAPDASDVPDVRRFGRRGVFASSPTARASSPASVRAAVAPRVKNGRVLQWKATGQD